MLSTIYFKKSYTQTKATCLVLFILLTISQWKLSLATSYNLVFDTVYSPPSVIPTDPKQLIYSVPLNQVTSRPIIAYVQDKMGKVVTTLPDTIQAYATSMDKSQKNTADPDSWRDSGGKLCQWSNHDKDWPERFNTDLYTTVCGSNSSTTTLIAKILKGKIILDWLMHAHPNGSLPPNERFIRIEIPDLKLFQNTSLLKITEPAASLKITTQPPTKITANTKFGITAEILDSKGATLTVGLDSVAFVELTVPYSYKSFREINKKNILLKSSIRLGGPLVMKNVASGDLVIRQRAAAGKVSFSDVRILDIKYNLKLNLTMFMSKVPFLRIPNCKECYSDVNFIKIDEDDIITYEMPPANVLSNIPSMAFTQDFEVIPQTYGSLKYINPLSGKGKMSITRNFPIPGPITIEIQDANKNRIYTGPDSKLKLNVQTEPRFVCLSSDTSAVSNEGIVNFVGSICDIKSHVVIIFFSNKLASVNTSSQPFEIVGKLNIGHFDHFEYTGGGRKLSPHINSFVRFAATDVNNGKIPSALPAFNMKLVVQTVDTKDDIVYAIDQYKVIRQEISHTPSNALHLSLLSGNRKVSSAMARILTNEKRTIISLDETDEMSIDSPLFNRVCWNSKQIFSSFLEFCKQRDWIRMTILKTSNTHISYSLFRLARQIDIYFDFVIIDEQKVQWASKDPDINSALSKAMESLKSFKNNIIVCFANHTQMPAILFVAQEQQVSPINGYQWVFVSKYAWSFPFNNSLACENVPVCTLVFKGSVLFTGAYNTSFMNTADWERVLNQFYSIDKSAYFGLTSIYPNADQSERLALAYDAVWLYAQALTKIVSNRLTATPQKISEELRKVNIHGLSGDLKLDENGQRIGFQANVRVINASEPKQPLKVVAPLQRYIELTNKKYIEYIYESPQMRSSNETILPTSLPESSVYNIRKFKSKTGRVSPINFQLIRYEGEPWPPADIIRVEKMIPPFNCSHPCGLKLSEENINKYDTGRCISNNQCKCNLGYFGSNCQNKFCYCSHGYCDKPYECICDEGYSGDLCSIPTCPDGCINGKCAEPNTCKCFQSHWIGHRCHIHIAAILIPFFIFLILFIYLGYIFFIFFRRRIERTIAFSNLDWLADWQDMVVFEKSSTSFKSMAVASSIGNMTTTLFAWKKQKWFVKKINSYTVDQDDERVRLEMVDLVSVRHPNLIVYGGACLAHPNVCLLVEATQRGSLEDQLLNESLQLNWDFRFSFMKDICRGMNYLQTKTKIGSHGRLKSSNCLLDNRWCVRITDFGAPTIRYGPYLIEKTESQKQDEYYSMQESLLWTAPELLVKATCLDDVRMGTKEGDVYSFGIIVSEIVTRDVPFAFERSHLNTATLLDLIVNRNSSRLEKDLELWKSLNPESYLVRPYIHPEYLPEGSLEKIKFLKMLEDVWDDNPHARITFQRIITIFDDLYPTKRDLMVNTMHLLESYTINLENAIIERTEALDAEKTKVEHIMNEMLPKEVIDDLKNGKKIPPQYFECVTVYFSNIIGFTSVAKNSQPFQVVNLLTNLYSLCDNILARYNVYKVESVGNVYVVSSGVPTLNKNLHAGEIASTSLDIMSSIMTMEMPSEAKLQLKLGINSGPVVAGVVGLKLPRYVLVGETMHICSVMESSSKPMHIQMTESTVKILKELGGFFFKYNGTVKVYGKNIETYWLIGKKGYEKPLPEVQDKSKN